MQKLVRRGALAAAALLALAALAPSGRAQTVVNVGGRGPVAVGQPINLPPTGVTPITVNLTPVVNPPAQPPILVPSMFRGGGLIVNRQTFTGNEVISQTAFSNQFNALGPNFNPRRGIVTNSPLFPVISSPYRFGPSPFTGRVNPFLNNAYYGPFQGNYFGNPYRFGYGQVNSYRP